MSTYIARGGETLCEIAILNGFNHCQRLRDENPHLRNVEVLSQGDRVTVPDIQERQETGLIETINRFVLNLERVPRIQFIDELGRGYGVNVPPPAGGGAAAAAEAGAGPLNRPELDPAKTRLAVANYVSDRGGDGTVVGNFPAATFFGHDPLGSNDPDHFKVQVIVPNAPASLSSVRVTLQALKPAYFRREVAGRAVVALHPTKWTRPTNAARKLENIECRRIPNTNYFRSPYLRLVSTQTSQARRPQQTLLMMDYFDEGPANYQKHYTEILHQKVEATTPFPACPVHKCVALRTGDLDATLTLHMAVHIVQGNGVTENDARRNIYTWTRRVLAPAHIRPVIEQVHTVAEPKNMLIVAGGGSGATAGSSATRGRHASGRNAAGAASQMTFDVDGHTVTYAPTRQHSPSQTADGIIAAIGGHADLAGYTARKFRNPFRNLAAAANQVSDPFDVLVFKPDGTPAEITNTQSTDRPNGGVGGQSLDRVRNFTLNNFPVNSVAFGGASDEQRILRWNFSVDNAINFYVVGQPIMLHRSGTPATTTLDGFSPYGTNLGWVTDVGPSVYITINGVKTRMFVLAHEMFHPLMHNVHADGPRNDANAGTAVQAQSVECMNASLLEVEAHDCTKHVSDSPIVAQYEFLESAVRPVVADGGAGPPPRTTPVRRLAQIAAGYGIVRTGAQTPLDAVVTDLPQRAEDA